MMKTGKPFLSLTAANLMTQPAVLLTKETSLRGAAQRLFEADVHGAPVVNDEGRCIGVISSMDFLCWARKTTPVARKQTARNAIISPWQIVEPSELPEDSVVNYMTPDPVMIPADTPIGELARKMLDAHIHRLVVVEDKGRPVGIVSCTDILAAVAYCQAET